MGTSTAVRAITRPTARQKVYYLYLVVANGAAWLSKASASEVSQKITTLNERRHSLGVPYTALTPRQMMGETIAIVAEVARSSE